MEGRGYRILLAEGGEAARYLPDLIVTDWNMPGMDGIALCERLKFYPALAQIPVVTASGRVPPKEKSTLWNVFLSKPVDVDALESAIDSLLAKRLSSPQPRVNVPAPAVSRWQPISSKLWAQLAVFAAVTGGGVQEKL
ncbi:response regulator [Paraburkholderia madseniana]|uniref:Response regulator n=1 Tax=Paraburkholderia madseniana TaxID=2599607 RepID=A0ABT3UNG2_9BURK|nr:response regulator [Paraburkholderia sp. WS6]MCX4150285.1 response regulator [Paraburkholderia madseniana]